MLFVLFFIFFYFLSLSFFDCVIFYFYFRFSAGEWLVYSAIAVVFISSLGGHPTGLAIPLFLILDCWGVQGKPWGKKTCVLVS